MKTITSQLFPNLRELSSCCVLASLVLLYVGLVFGPPVHELALAHNLDFKHPAQVLLGITRCFRA